MRWAEIEGELVDLDRVIRMRWVPVQVPMTDAELGHGHRPADVRPTRPGRVLHLIFDAGPPVAIAEEHALAVYQLLTGGTVAGPFAGFRPGGTTP